MVIKGDNQIKLGIKFTFTGKFLMNFVLWMGVGFFYACVFRFYACDPDFYAWVFNFYACDLPSYAWKSASYAYALF